MTSLLAIDSEAPERVSLHSDMIFGLDVAVVRLGEPDDHIVIEYLGSRGLHPSLPASQGNLPLHSSLQWPGFKVSPE